MSTSSLITQDLPTRDVIWEQIFPDNELVIKWKEKNPKSETNIVSFIIELNICSYANSIGIKVFELINYLTEDEEYCSYICKALEANYGSRFSALKGYIYNDYIYISRHLALSFITADKYEYALILYNAIIKQRIDIVKIILPKYKGNCSTILMTGCVQGDELIVKYLLSVATFTNACLFNCLYRSIYRNQLSCIKLLIPFLTEKKYIKHAYELAIKHKNEEISTYIEKWAK